MIELINISKSYNKNSQNEVTIFENFNLRIDSGEMVAIIGRSGSGKSTLLGIISGLIPFDSGDYYFNSKKIDQKQIYNGQFLRRNNIGIIVQNYALINDISVQDNVLIALHKLHFSQKAKKEKVAELLKKMGLTEQAKKYPSELSGGQCQRIAIARAIISGPQILIADEPTGALDEITEDQVMDILQCLNREGMTIIIATHNSKIAQKCNRIISL